MRGKCRSEAKQWLKILKAYYSVAKVIILFFPTLDRDVTNRLTLLGGGGGGVNNHRLFDIIYHCQGISGLVRDFLKITKCHEVTFAKCQVFLLLLCLQCSSSCL